MGVFDDLVADLALRPCGDVAATVAATGFGVSSCNERCHHGQIVFAAIGQNERPEFLVHALEMDERVLTMRRYDVDGDRCFIDEVVARSHELLAAISGL